MAVEGCIANGKDFVVTYDLRNHQDWTTCNNPSEHAACLRKFFCEESRASKLRKAKLAALLFKGSIFVEETVAFLGEFVELITPSCPLILSHSQTTARNFFRSTIGGEMSGGFVSLVAVEPGKHTAPDTETCVASLAPLSKTSGIFKAHAEAPPTYHMLPNGDVRVIQSPPADIVMGRPVLSNIAEDKDIEIADAPVKLGSGAALSCGELPSVSALLLKGPQEGLRRLIGVHFNIAELLIDADAKMETDSKSSASLSTRAPSRASATSSRRPVQKPRLVTTPGCLSGWLLTCANTFFSSPRSGLRVPHLKIRTPHGRPRKKDLEQHMQHYGY